MISHAQTHILAEFSVLPFKSFLHFYLLFSLIRFSHIVYIFFLSWKIFFFSLLGLFFSSLPLCYSSFPLPHVTALCNGFLSHTLMFLFFLKNFSLLGFFKFYFMCMCVHVCVCVCHIYAVPWSSEDSIKSLEAEVTRGCDHLMWVLRIELPSSGRAANALNGEKPLTGLENISFLLSFLFSFLAFPTPHLYHSPFLFLLLLRSSQPCVFLLSPSQSPSSSVTG